MSEVVVCKLEKLFTELFVFWDNQAGSDKKKPIFDCDMKFSINDASFEVIKDTNAPGIFLISILNTSYEFQVAFYSEYRGGQQN